MPPERTMTNPGWKIQAYFFPFLRCCQQSVAEHEWAPFVVGSRQRAQLNIDPTVFQSLSNMIKKDRLQSTKALERK